MARPRCLPILKHTTFAVLKGFFAISSSSIDHLIPANFTDHLQGVSTILRTSFNYPMSSLVPKRAHKRPSLLRQRVRVWLINQRCCGHWAIKDGAYYCYCAYVLRISRYSDFLSPLLTNTGIFLRGLKLSGESRS